MFHRKCKIENLKLEIPNFAISQFSIFPSKFKVEFCNSAISQFPANIGELGISEIPNTTIFGIFDLMPYESFRQKPG